MNTKQRLLEAAVRAFAEKGFRDATVAEICEKAKANIAAVNYHFGSKENLYEQAWRHARIATLEAYPPDGGVRPDAPPAERLRGRILAMLQRALCDDGLELRIMSHETANPTGLLRQVTRETIRPLREQTENIVRELLGEDSDEQTIRLCAMSVIAPCLQLMRRGRMHRRRRQGSWIKPDRLEALVEHFTAFALAGMEGVRRARHGGPAEHAEPDSRGSDRAARPGQDT